jgi:hypothetical protein
MLETVNGKGVGWEFRPRTDWAGRRKGRPARFLDEEDKAFILSVAGSSNAEIRELFLDFRGRPVTLKAIKDFLKEQGVDRNKSPIGTVRTKKNGYAYEKLADGSWEASHRLVWARHNGAIPPGHHVIFIDRDRTNLAPGNLMLITREQFLYIKRHWFKWDDEKKLRDFLDAAARDIESRKEARACHSQTSR